ncbi:MAG TPA: peptidoglycan DD-metalloendopeptidase family protein [Kofleriaceae bacterium]|nr:peptidoglycan DD-metalloendopeptidase family protein [Kofleriaceae bacterium]
MPFVEPILDLGDLEDLVDVGPPRAPATRRAAAAVRAATIPGPATPPARSTATSTPIAGTSAASLGSGSALASSAGSPRTSASACPVCSGPVDVRSPHIAVAGGAVRVYCSRACLDAKDALPADANTISLALPRRSRRYRWLLAALVAFAAGGAGAFALLRTDQVPAAAPPAPAIPVAAVSLKPEPTPDTIADPNREADAKLVADLMHDAWIHPLAGPNRRMPRAHTGAFGAERAGERPPECVSGHCGVDLGHTWGEPVHAVHDGVVEFINRGPNEERGGVFVRISHRDGTLFSWYFHLAAVPRSLQRGDKVKAGQVIGVLGDTGIKHSAPHLHFALSVKPTKNARERYLDPESLIAIWPLWMPDESGTGGHLATRIEPGLPVRADHKRSKRSKKHGASSKDAIAAPDEPVTEPDMEADSPASAKESAASSKVGASATAKTPSPGSTKITAPATAKTPPPGSSKTAAPATAKTPPAGSSKAAAPAPTGVPSPTPAASELPRATGTN